MKPGNKEVLSEEFKWEWKAKLNSFIISNVLKLEWKTKLDAFIVYNKLLKYLKYDNPSLIVELLLNLLISLLHP